MPCKNCGYIDPDECVSIVPSVECIRILKGTDLTLQFVLTNADDDPVDISLDSVRFTIVDEPGGTTKIQKTNGPGSHLVPIEGQTEFEISRSDISETITDSALFWIYEIRRIQPSGDEAVHLTGVFVVDQPVGG